MVNDILFPILTTDLWDPYYYGVMFQFFVSVGMSILRDTGKDSALTGICWDSQHTESCKVQSLPYQFSLLFSKAGTEQNYRPILMPFRMVRFSFQTYYILLLNSKVLFCDSFPMFDGL